MSKIIEFLQDYNIQYWEQHSIVSTGYIGLMCPFCMDHAKPYLGMRKDGASLNSSCWRCGSHSAYDTVEALTGVSDKNQIYGIIRRYKGESSFYTPSQEVERKAPLKIEIPGIPKLIPPAKKYLEKRNFNPEYVYEKFHLRTTTYDNPSYRIIFPFIFNRREVSWTGRTYANAEVRYISCPHDKEIIPHKSIFYNYDNQKKGGNVLLVEGILDAVRTNGMATAGTAVTKSQILLLRDFAKVFIMFDGSVDAIKKAHEIGVLLSSVGVDNEVLELDEGEDPDTAFMDNSDLIYLKKDLKLY